MEDMRASESDADERFSSSVRITHILKEDHPEYDIDDPQIYANHLWFFNTSYCVSVSPCAMYTYAKAIHGLSFVGIPFLNMHRAKEIVSKCDKNIEEIYKIWSQIMEFALFDNTFPPSDIVPFEWASMNVSMKSIQMDSLNDIDHMIFHEIFYWIHISGPIFEKNDISYAGHVGNIVEDDGDIPNIETNIVSELVFLLDTKSLTTFTIHDPENQIIGRDVGEIPINI